MGYRNYIAPIKKSEYDRIKNFTKEELYKDKNEPLGEDGHVGVYDCTEDPLYELGKYVDEFDKGFFSPVFLNKDLQNDMTEEHDFYIVGKEFLKFIIEGYALKIKSHYNNMCVPFFGENYKPSEFMNSISSKYDDNMDPNYTFDYSKITQSEANALFAMLEHIRSMRIEWCQLTPYNIDRGDNITTSWKYEYAQFELVRIYKTFDWDNYLMIYYGH